jgi:hypothetical protein
VAVEAASTPKIYRPQQTGGSRANIPLILLAVVAIVGMVGMALGGLGGIGGAQQAARPDFEFVYDDGNVTVAMFYADW